MKICNKCNAENKDINNFCIECGENIQDIEIIEDKKIVCPVCGEEKKDNYFFCSKCGNVLDIEKAKEVENVKESTWEKPVEEVIEDKNVNSLAKLSFLLGLISLIAFFVPLGMPFSIVISLFALTTGIVSLVRKPNIETKKAKIGIILASIAFILCIIVFIFIGPVIDYLSEVIGKYCFANSTAEECLLLKDLLPGLFK